MTWIHFTVMAFEEEVYQYLSQYPSCWTLLRNENDPLPPGESHFVGFMYIHRRGEVGAIKMMDEFCCMQKAHPDFTQRVLRFNPRDMHCRVEMFLVKPQSQGSCILM